MGLFDVGGFEGDHFCSFTRTTRKGTEIDRGVRFCERGQR